LTKKWRENLTFYKDFSSNQVNLNQCHGLQADRGDRLNTRVVSESVDEGDHHHCAYFERSSSVIEQGMFQFDAKVAEEKTFESYIIPQVADFVFAYSTLPNFKSKLDIEFGSWFINDLCQALESHHSTDDLLSILTRTAAMVTQRCGESGQMQSPFVLSMLTREVYFKAKANSETCSQLGMYNMSNSRRRLAIIFNHRTYCSGLDLKPRVGTDVDEEKLKETLEYLGFAPENIKVHRDLTSKKIDEVLQSVQAEDHTDVDCLVVAALTHGEEGVLYASDSMYRTDTLWHGFNAENCPTLAGKPKIFILQVILKISNIIH
jgi:hypothetical protein